MKCANSPNLILLILSAVLIFASAGCLNKSSQGVTPLQGRTAPDIEDTGPAPAVEAQPPQPPQQPEPEQAQSLQQEQPTTSTTEKTPEGYSTPPRVDMANRPLDKEIFSEYTVYFDFDSSVVKSSEQSKVESVADHLEQNPSHALLIEGHCDERGTEEYNRALGERRALSVREYLINLGINADRIFTISYGEDRPAVEGQNESVWSQNRRAEFGLLRPRE